jgi:hypothetical protein
MLWPEHERVNHGPAAPPAGIRFKAHLRREPLTPHKNFNPSPIAQKPNSRTKPGAATSVAVSSKHPTLSTKKPWEDHPRASAIDVLCTSAICLGIISIARKNIRRVIYSFVAD